MFIHPIMISNISNRRSIQMEPMQKQNIYNKTPISFLGDEDYFDYEKVLKKKLDERSGFLKFFDWGKSKARKEATHELIGFTAGQKELSRQKDQNIIAQQEALKAKEQTLLKEEEKTKLLEEQLKMAKEAHAKDKYILELSQKLEEAKNRVLLAKEDVIRQTEKVNAIRQEQQILTKREKGKGWDKIAGHEDLKRQIEEAFINKLALEKSGCDVYLPNGILFYGQHGTGKTRFAKAFAEQAGCEFVEIDTMQADEDVIDDLVQALKKSKKTYLSPETPKKRTIILLDDFDSIAQLSREEEDLLKNNQFDFSDTNVGQLAEILSNCADKYKATIFMTTNHPRKINSEILNDELTPYQIFLGPPSPLDASKIFKYHLNGFTNQQIDYQKLGNEVSKVIKNDEAYSAQGIVNVVNYAKEQSNNSSVTEDDLLKAIKKVEPDISKATFEAFIDDMIALRSKLESQDGEG